MFYIFFKISINCKIYVFIEVKISGTNNFSLTLAKISDSMLSFTSYCDKTISSSNSGEIKDLIKNSLTLIMLCPSLNV